jgi:DNA-binding MurR/RpiR family transcriptional regulator
MNRDALLDELSRIEREVVEGERMLAEHEARLIALTKQNQDTSKAEAALYLMREDQKRRDQDRHRLLSLLQR